MKERQFAPEISEDQLDAPITVTEGGEVSLDVTVNGKPKPDVKWYKDDKLLRESNRLDIKARGDKHSVVILGIKAEDSGVYKCEAKSKMGTVTRTFDVRVQGMIFSLGYNVLGTVKLHYFFKLVVYVLWHYSEVKTDLK